MRCLAVACWIIAAALNVIITLFNASLMAAKCFLEARSPPWVMQVSTKFVAITSSCSSVRFSSPAFMRSTAMSFATNILSPTSLAALSAIVAATFTMFSPRTSTAASACKSWRPLGSTSRPMGTCSCWRVPSAPTNTASLFIPW